MSEAIIARGGRKGGEYSTSRLVTEVYTSSTLWVVPSNAVNNEFSVRIFGGGGGGYYSFGGDFPTISERSSAGGGGWMNNAEIQLTPGNMIEIMIGSGGKGTIVNDGDENSAMANSISRTGWTTFFGTYLSANGASSGNFYDRNNVRGGDGGSGGGGGGIGYQFGGGASLSSTVKNGGNGGPWGGGGGSWNNYGIGGTYGGNGGYRTIQAENGTNTIGWTNVGTYLNGEYITGRGLGGGQCGGGGGYGGDGGNSYFSAGIADAYGGGGGYGAKGGNSGGGGGGYGRMGNGGDGVPSSATSFTFSAYGGGGAYGRGGSVYNNGVALPPLFGGGGYCIELLNIPKSQWYRYNFDGADGICIIQYYSI